MRFYTVRKDIEMLHFSFHSFKQILFKRNLSTLGIIGVPSENTQRRSIDELLADPFLNDHVEVKSPRNNFRGFRKRVLN